MHGNKYHESDLLVLNGVAIYLTCCTWYILKKLNFIEHKHLKKTKENKFVHQRSIVFERDINLFSHRHYKQLSLHLFVMSSIFCTEGDGFSLHPYKIYHKALSKLNLVYTLRFKKPCRSILT